MGEDFKVTVQDASEPKVVSGNRPQAPAPSPSPPSPVDQEDVKKPLKKGVE